MKLRTFFALRVPERLARDLANFSDELCEYDRGLDALWVDSSGYHLTLSFLGDIDLDQVELLESRVRDISLGQRFDVQLDHIGYYAVNPSLSVVAVMTAQQEELIRLQQSLVDIATDVGIELDFAIESELPKIDKHLPADSVVLLQSRPGEKGSIYTPLFEVELPRSDV
ncbi:MAG: hypothetical protein RL143_1395 [Pseudomonadota bacterium]